MTRRITIKGNGLKLSWAITDRESTDIMLYLAKRIDSEGSLKQKRDETGKFTGIFEPERVGR